MKILIVGNILKDVYLNLDDRTEHLETDNHGTKWLDLAFNASEHHFFNRESSLGGAAVTLEVLTKMGLESTITGSTLDFTTDNPTLEEPAEAYRYILIMDDQPCYIAPTNYRTTTFTAPDDFYDYIFVDRSAELSHTTAKRLLSYLQLSQDTKLILYLRHLNNQHLNQLIPHASLIFQETPSTPNQKSSPNITTPLSTISPSKIINISDSTLSYLDIHEPISVSRIDIRTHLSTYSIAAATILGNFILGGSVEESLRLARINLENSKLNSTLTLDELHNISTDTINSKLEPTSNKELELIATNLVLPPKGILAADESGGSIHKKFEQLNIPDTYENRRDYRNLLLTTPNLGQYVNGVILFDETTHQTADNGQNFVNFLTANRIIPGVKVDQGLEHFDDSDETYTKGLDGLSIRLAEYRASGLRFTKWRSAFTVHLDYNGEPITPTDYAIEENCRILAEYASACQSAGLVPIVEPELVYDGYYSIEQSATITGKILDYLFDKLNESHINLRACILKTNMILAGKRYEIGSTPDEVGKATAEVLRTHVPDTLAGIVFLSGGQSPEQATNNLTAIMKNAPFPWPVTFSFARALQDPALHAWTGDNTNTNTAQKAFQDRLIANCQALTPQPPQASTSENPSNPHRLI